MNYIQYVNSKIKLKKKYDKAHRQKHGLNLYKYMYLNYSKIL